MGCASGLTIVLWLLCFVTIFFLPGLVFLFPVELIFNCDFFVFSPELLGCSVQIYPFSNSLLILSLIIIISPVSKSKSFFNTKYLANDSKNTLFLENFLEIVIH